LTTELSVFGREGSAGGFDVPVELPLLAAFMLGGSVEAFAIGHHQYCGSKFAQHVHFSPAPPALSHGLGGDTVLILGAKAADEMAISKENQLNASGIEPMMCQRLTSCACGGSKFGGWMERAEAEG
jgi:hypothetical protein